MANDPTEPPYLALSTPHASYRNTADGTGDGSDVWQHVIVVVAELTPKTNSLVVCPALECELAPYPLEPMVQLLFPEDTVFIVSCNEETGDIGFRHVDALKGQTSTFVLRFASRLEFWDCLHLISNVQNEAQARRADLTFRMSQVLDSIPSHSPTFPGGSYCANGAHKSKGDEIMRTDP
ncbi:hypothetical protein GSI_01687 [Ganoderma sinense ZZ0214-1]|uniref:Uncharacterized protein n=1 Tax=Ganoderma sinense ZZ0214-1 TaxID=1077348 RepID=A0A2G8SQI0_9APHY|nr:hypothetical protein GSI_01687 [Ganoderma sinense ZZ0214-1]